MKERIEPYARRFVRFAVPGPDTTPAEIRRRGRMVAACAFVVIVVASIAYACIGSQQQSICVKLRPASVSSIASSSSVFRKPAGMPQARASKMPGLPASGIRTK
jgi:hypothetical protein